MVPTNAETDNTNSETDNTESAQKINDELGVVDEAQLLWRDLRGLIADHVQLAALEAQRMGESIVTMLVCGVVIGVLLVSAWLGVAAVLVLWLIHVGVLAYLALLIAVVLNLLGVVFLIRVIRRKSHHLGFPATVKSLRQLLESTVD